MRTAFIAASVLRLHTYADAKTRLDSSAPVIHHDILKPHHSTVTTVDDFKIRGLVPLKDHQESQFLYRAYDCLGKPVLVKFTPTYSSELHKFCAKKGHALALLACQRLPGGWYGVVMEYLHDIEPISLSPSLGTYQHIWEGQLKTLVNSFHEHGLVHGDLRDANMLCYADGRLVVIDFDWGGKEGVACYPTFHLHDELKHGRTSTSLTITEVDNEGVLEITLKKWIKT